MRNLARWALALCVALTAALGADEPRLVIDSGGHQDLIEFLAFTRDGKSMISAGIDKVLRIWDVTTGRTIRTILGQVGDGDEGKIYAAALSPDERYLAVGGWLGADPDFGVIRIHEFNTGDVVALLRGHTGTVHALAFSADSRWLASGSSDDTVKIWDTTGWKFVQTLTVHQDDVYAVAFSPDDRASGQILTEMVGHQKEVSTATFSPDGRYIVSGGYDRTVKLWDGHSGAFIRDLASQGSVAAKLPFLVREQGGQR